MIIRRFYRASSPEPPHDSPTAFDIFYNPSGQQEDCRTQILPNILYLAKNECIQDFISSIPFNNDHLKTNIR